MKRVTCSNVRHGVVVYPQALAGLPEDQTTSVVDEFLPNAELGHVMPPNFAVRVLRKFKHRPDRRLSDDFAEPLVLEPLEGSSSEEMGGTWPTALPGPRQVIATPSGN